MRWVRGFVLIAACAACSDGAPSPVLPADGLVCTGALSPGPAPIRRMTRFEYNNTVRDLLGDTSWPADDFAAEESSYGFDNNATDLVVSSALAEKYMRAAEGIASRATENLHGLVPCASWRDEALTCVRDFVVRFGQRAFRRPLTPDEVAMFTDLFEVGRAQDGIKAGVQMVLEAMLQSPPFLYRVEFGAPAAPGEPVVALDPWERASRLSYFLWGTMPDDELFAAAESGHLASPEGVATQARRMLDDARAEDAILEFHRQWLGLDRMSAVGKDATLFPAWSPALGQKMLAESQAFISHVVLDRRGDLRTLLTAPYSFMNADLAAFYGVTGPSGAAFEPVELDPEQRAGILTQAALLTIYAHSDQTSPVHRGKFVREQILCDRMPPPPPDLVIVVPEPSADSTAKERFAAHSESSACSGCHARMDPLGFGFESFDAIGRFRDVEAGAPIDDTGEITGTDVDAPFDGAVELAQKLAASQDAARCYATQWFRFAYGRNESGEDACTLAALHDAFAASGGNIQELLVALTQTDAFLYKKAGSAR